MCGSNPIDTISNLFSSGSGSTRDDVKKLRGSQRRQAPRPFENPRNARAPLPPAATAQGVKTQADPSQVRLANTRRRGIARFLIPDSPTPPRQARGGVGSPEAGSGVAI